MAEAVRALIVEDDEIAAGLLARALGRHGFDVQATGSVQQALSLSEQWRPQAAVVDLRLPQGSGLSLIPALVQRQPGIRILMLTGFASIATAVQAIKLGASEYLSKPAPIVEIIAALRDGRRQTRRRAPARRSAGPRYDASNGNTSSRCWPSTAAISPRLRARCACSAAPCSASSPSGRPQLGQRLRLRRPPWPPARLTASAIRRSPGAPPPCPRSPARSCRRVPDRSRRPALRWAFRRSAPRSARPRYS